MVLVQTQESIVHSNDGKGGVEVVYFYCELVPRVCRMVLFMIKGIPNIPVLAT